jgi:hippurate hydrolase
VEFAVRVAEEIVGADMVDADAAPRNGGEDFGAMLARRPGAFFYLGQGDGPYLHDPRFDANDATLPIGASFFARLVERRQPL